MEKLRQMLARGLYSVTNTAMLANLRELNDHQWRSADELAALQTQWLARVLEYADVHIPYYRDLFRQIGFRPADFVANPACFQELPLLTKAVLREHHDRLITTDPAKQHDLIKAKTGGTTGQPIWFTQDSDYNNYRIAHNFFQMQWSGWQLGQPEGRLWGHVLAGKSLEKSLSTRLKEQFVARFWANAFNLTPESMEQFARQLEGRPDIVVWSYVSTLYRFAQFVKERGRPIRLHAVYTAAEPLYDYHRQFIEEVFHCRVFNSYSSVETGDIACECEQHSGLHLMMRNVYLEVLRDGRPVPDGEPGEFVITNLTNVTFPLIRYKIEDGGKMRVGPCACGRGLPMLETVEGRIIDFFQTRDRGRVWGAFVVPMVPLLGEIHQYQIVQKSLDLIVIQVMAPEPLDTAKFADIQRACKIALGETVETRLEYVESLPATPTGKHRYVISEVK